jgi:hypothetical protein
MENLLTAAEAYEAGKQDAAEAAHAATPEGNRRAPDREVFVETLVRLWQARIDRGELLPVDERTAS